MAPSFHSWKSPINKIIKNTNNLTLKNMDAPLTIILNTGNKSAISTSKIKNNTTKTKNRVENGVRLALSGSNPHSKGVDFSSALEICGNLVKK
uniref:NADH dehydrogenase subunit 3 n=1 Tax=Onchidium reevesii TaxID=2547651 RepID=K9JY79_9EUPU|nr:NADH dehydrogenase subunit 3 [Onchidium reevesii]ADZ61661.1 NADH dehydrogenase subunit 3 [Onchidium reevesii]UZH97735.1 NADH dehydrogenase subunit 3 [Onchidium reevesii]